MPRRRKPAPKEQRSITARPVYRDKPDIKAMSTALVYWSLNNPDVLRNTKRKS